MLDCTVVSNDRLGVLGKAVNYFLRDVTVRAALVKDLQRRGLAGLAVVIKDASLPNFAQWRWATLDNVCAELSRFIDSLALHFNVAVFARVAEEENKTRLRLVRESLASPQWFHQFNAVKWLCHWICRIMEFAGACPCHLDEYFRGDVVTCKKKGRVLPLCYNFAMERLREGLAE
eukprot:1640659-Pyramimonas_sp.AAC.1